MKTLERIFLYSVLAVLVFYVFLVDGNVESQVAIQEEIRSRRIAIVNDEGQEVVTLLASENGGGRVDIYNKEGIIVADMSTTGNGDGTIGIGNKASTLVVDMGVYKDDGLIMVLNRHSNRIGSLP